MSQDLEIINRVMDRIGITANKVQLRDYMNNFSYALDKKKNVIGLSFRGFGLTKFPKEIFDLFGKLFERMRRGLNRNHLEWDGNTNSWQISKDDVVRARISADLESDEDYGHHPLIVIDGKEIRWDEFGRMLMTYEGFHFKLEIFDRSEEIS